MLADAKNSIKLVLEISDAFEQGNKHDFYIGWNGQIVQTANDRPMTRWGEGEFEMDFLLDLEQIKEDTISVVMIIKADGDTNPENDTLRLTYYAALAFQHDLEVSVDNESALAADLETWETIELDFKAENRTFNTISPRDLLRLYVYSKDTLFILDSIEVGVEIGRYEIEDLKVTLPLEAYLPLGKSNICLSLVLIGDIGPGVESIEIDNSNNENCFEVTSVMGSTNRSFQKDMELRYSNQGVSLLIDAQGGSLDNARADIYTIDGQLVSRGGNLHTGRNMLPVQSLSKGLYFVMVRTDNQALGAARFVVK